jgi:alkanesulfonate monooxygenase SsuD/methylene tetrahydromethanopterin reductase-like flavin-dependent oxidoreductase (luciferase family)
VHYGVNVPNVGDLELLLELGVETERGGWDGFFVWDQMGFLVGVPTTVFDPWVLLAALAARTERIRLGTMVTPVARRRPWKLARETVTLDRLSGGRLTLGVGLGYPPDADFELLGEDPDERVRAAKLDEGLELLTRLWSGETVDFEGNQFRVRDTRFLPTPVQRPRIPVWVGGMWPNRAPFRRAARWDGVYPIKVTAEGEPFLLAPEEFAEALAYVAEHRRSAEPFDAVASGVAGGDHAAIAPFEEAGATWWLESDEGEPGWEARLLERVRAGPPR